MYLIFSLYTNPNGIFLKLKRILNVRAKTFYVCIKLAKLTHQNVTYIEKVNDQNNAELQPEQ